MHLVETMVSGMSETPWHGLGKVVDGALTAEEALKLGGLDWKVKKTPIWTPDYDADVTDPAFGIGNFKQSSRDFAIVRSTDSKVLGVVGKTYTPLQNESAFRFFDALVSRKEAIYQTAGALDEGRVVWLLAQLPQDIVLRTPTGEQDITHRYVLIYNSFDGRSSVTAKMTNIRVVCNNTVTAALRDGEPKFTIPHTKSVEEQMATMAESMGLIGKMTSEFTEAAQAMIHTQVKNEAQALDFLRACWDADYKPASEAEALEQEQEPGQPLARAVRKSLELFETGKGMDLSPNSVWNLYQAVCEFGDHEARYRTADGRLKNAWFEGPQYAAKIRAYKKAVELVRA